MALHPPLWVFYTTLPLSHPSLLPAHPTPDRFVRGCGVSYPWPHGWACCPHPPHSWTPKALEYGVSSWHLLSQTVAHHDFVVSPSGTRGWHNVSPERIWFLGKRQGQSWAHQLNLSSFEGSGLARCPHNGV